MDIVIGSKNKTKINAVKKVFPNQSVYSYQVPSGVSAQPFSDEETKQGAINRAKACLEKANFPALAIGLEGGVMFIGKDLYLCNWGALITSEENIYTASGARIKLPLQIGKKLLQGLELGKAIEQYVQKKDIRSKEGTIGVFTNELVNRTDLFVHVTKLLKGQYEYWQ